MESGNQRVTCIKCKVLPSDIKIRQANFCKSCFQLNFITKFKSNLARSAAPQTEKRPNLLVAFSGGNSSRALLQLCSDFQTPGSGTKLQQKYNEMLILHLDESAIFEDQDAEKSIMEIIEKYPFKCITKKLEDVFSSSRYSKFVSKTTNSKGLFFSHSLEKETNESPKDLLVKLFEGIKSTTSKEYMLECIKHHLLLEAARENGCEVIAVGNSATRIAVKSILMTSEGRGFSLPFDVGAESTLEEDVYIVRPLRSSLSKEIVYYNNLLGLESVTIPTFSTKANANSKIMSLGYLTENFISGLDLEYSATVPTVTSTVGKLKVNANATTNKKCLICLAPIGDNASTWRKNVTIDSLDNTLKELKDDSSKIDENIKDENLVNVENSLCYSCLSLASDTENDTILPGFVQI
ncbi:hypothetical protein BB559_002906 [Furculomyces boomerangus]|uniref:Cytoplasmic tRNA 2-thiolation protein 2 n=2 Tax=Harpellales TaxID=61421 RepID=A0A2T9YR91_9FUNG|nr:hypothetical protein BB559_002906 [Furculomyces boomerangus]PVZ97813.1 hypothetical protein BB558_006219 [Smittium angustum]PVZ98826.1 hypothetical protein BB558_005160 [Smittium angustum]